MPTQEQINEANVELQIANDNYALLNEKLNKYREAIETYQNASPEVQEKAAGAMSNLLKSYEELRLQQYVNEDRIQQAQNKVNSYNEIIANQSAQVKPVARVYRPNPNGTVTVETVAETPTVVPTVIPTPEVVTEVPTEVAGKQTLLIPGQGMVTINGDSTLNIPQWVDRSKATIGTQKLNIPQWVDKSAATVGNNVVPTTNTRRTVTVTPVSNFVNGVRSIPNKISGAVQMAQTTPGLLSNTNNTLDAYNRATTWNGVNGLRNNIYGGIDLAKSVPGTLSAANRFLGGVNTYRGM